MAVQMSTSSRSTEFDVPRLNVTAGSWSVRGKSRDKNEDCDYISPAMNLFIVADGMGGHDRGEIASRFAIDALAHSLAGLQDAPHTDEEIEVTVRAALEHANCLILDLSAADESERLPGTTVVLALLFGERLFVTGIGDSLAYLLREGTVEKLTDDDTVTAFLEESGVISAEEALEHPARHQLLASLGMREFKPDQEIRVLDVRPGDRFLLCSDGLSDVVGLDQIKLGLETEHDPRRAAKELVELALWNGAMDDATCVFFRIDSVPARREVPVATKGVGILERLRRWFGERSRTPLSTVRYRSLSHS